MSFHLLLESGDRLLLEDGGALLEEHGAPVVPAGGSVYLSPVSLAPYKKKKKKRPQFVLEPELVEVRAIDEDEELLLLL